MSSTKSPAKHKDVEEHNPKLEKTEKQRKADNDAIVNNSRLTEQEKSAELGRQPIREALEGKNVELTFPTQDTWQIFKNGKTDSGSVTVPINTIVERADRL